MGKEKASYSHYSNLAVKASKYSMQGFSQRLQNRGICLVLKEQNLSAECGPQRTSATAKISGLNMY